MDKIEALARLREELKPGDTVHTILRHVSRSGMHRRISLVKLDGDGTFQLDRLAAIAGLATLDKRKEGLRVGGCGMDMGFHLVYELSHMLYPQGYECIGEKCPSNDHSNGDRVYTPHLHKSGGYALKHRWL